MATIIDIPEEKAIQVNNFEFTYAGVSEPNLKNITIDRKSTRLNSSHVALSRMPSSD